MLSTIVSRLNDHPLEAIALILAAGILLGRFQVRRMSLGSSGVLFVAMVLGHFGVVMPAIVGDLGVALFVYSVGLQAGPHFLRSIRRHGISFVCLALVTLTVAWITAAAGAWWFGLERELAPGIYAGALTSTPALAASLQALDSPLVSVGFGVAYPLGVVGVILFVQLAPRALRFDWEAEVDRAKAADSSPPIEVAWYRIANPQVEGKTVHDIETSVADNAVISRIMDQYVALAPQPETQLAVGQHVRAVGTADQCRRLELVLGPRVDDFREPRSALTSATVVVTEESLRGKSLRSLRLRERYGVTVTRLWRDDFEIVPGGGATLEFGDEIRVVGDVDDCQRFVNAVGHRPEKLHDTNFLALGLAWLAGMLLGQIPIPLTHSYALRLGLAGGPLLAGLAVGHFGRIGPINFRMPLAARLFMNEFGLILFLAAAGLHAGSSFWEVARSQGAVLLSLALAVTAVPLFTAFAMARYWFRWDALHALGAVCGAMTCTPGLGVVSKLANSSAPATAYVAVYPIALIAVSVLAPLLGAFLPPSP
ncbi:MAG: hypothetical protein KDA61_12090 [Planctomycetales bacterium]|nr:hypothetical protein [Planctomycetales bacterium]